MKNDFSKYLINNVLGEKGKEYADEIIEIANENEGVNPYALLSRQNKQLTSSLILGLGNFVTYVGRNVLEKTGIIPKDNLDILFDATQLGATCYFGYLVKNILETKRNIKNKYSTTFNTSKEVKRILKKALKKDKNFLSKVYGLMDSEDQYNSQETPNKKLSETISFKVKIDSGNITYDEVLLLFKEILNSGSSKVEKENLYPLINDILRTYKKMDKLDKIHKKYLRKQKEKYEKLSSEISKNPKKEKRYTQQFEKISNSLNKRRKKFEIKQLNLDEGLNEKYMRLDANPYFKRIIERKNSYI